MSAPKIRATSIALAASLAAAGVVAAPLESSASEVIVKGDKCTFNYSGDLGTPYTKVRTRTMTKAQAQKELDRIIAKEKAYLDKGGKRPATGSSEGIDDYLEVNGAGSYLAPGLRACIKGRNLSYDESEWQSGLFYPDGSPMPAMILWPTLLALLVVGGVVGAAWPQIAPMLPAKVTALIP